MAKQLLFLEFNEINFEAVEYYCTRGYDLPNLRDLISRNGWATTYSEKKYEELEPWIQWVTAHTGRTLSEHGVFRLGDIVHKDIPQIWEFLEDHGLRVGAVSPMNAKNRLRQPSFFIPDPWTNTPISGGGILRGLYSAIAQAVNDNAANRLTIKSALRLLVGFARYARLHNYSAYLRSAASAKSSPWRKAIFLDLLLSDIFVREVRRTRPHFATLFLNAGAHIQHHYLFSAECYEGPHRNPPWYLTQRLDPVLEVYQAYDKVLGQIRRTFPGVRLMIATALHQEPHGRVTYYWRLREHSKFLTRIGVPFSKVEPRMSRDFLVVCSSTAEAKIAEERLRSAIAKDGEKLFEVDNRGTDLFVMLTYPSDVGESLDFSIDGECFLLTSSDVAFVALKNGEHSGIGYFLDTERRLAPTTDHFALAEIPNRIAQALEVGPIHSA